MAMILYGWAGVEKSTEGSQILTHTCLFLFEDSEPSGVTNRKAIPMAFTAYHRRGRACVRTQAALRYLCVDDFWPS